MTLVPTDESKDTLKKHGDFGTKAEFYQINN